MTIVRAVLGYLPRGQRWRDDERTDAAEFAGPGVLRCLLVPTAEPREQPPIRQRRGQRSIGTVRIVELKELSENQADRPAVEQDVVKREDHRMPRLRPAHHQEPHRRRTTYIETLTAFFSRQPVQDISLRAGGSLAEVKLAPRQVDDLR